MKTAFPLFVAVLFTLVPPSGPPRVLAQAIVVERADTASALTYRLSHPMHEVEATSREVRYRAEIDTAKRRIAAVTASVDVMTFNSGNSNRDSHAMEVVDALTYPDAEFASTSVAQGGDSITVAGTVTFHGVTKDATMTGTVRWFPDRVNVKGGFRLSLTEYGIERPSLLMIPVDDTLRFDLDATLLLK